MCTSQRLACIDARMPLARFVSEQANAAGDRGEDRRKDDREVPVDDAKVPAQSSLAQSTTQNENNAPKTPQRGEDEQHHGDEISGRLRTCG
mgnify:FL=1